MLSVNHQIVGASIARPPFKRHHKQTVGDGLPDGPLPRKRQSNDCQRVVEDADTYEDSFFL